MANREGHLPVKNVVSLGHCTSGERESHVDKNSMTTVLGWAYQEGGRFLK